MKIYQRKDGKYGIKYLKEGLVDGKIYYCYIYGDSKLEVLERYHQKMHQLSFLSFDKNCLGVDIIKWLKKVEIRCKKTTYSNYQYIVNARIIPKFANMKKKDITTELIDRYTSGLLLEGLQSKTVKDILIILQSILKFAGMNVLITMPKVSKKEIQILSKEDQLKLEKNYFLS